MTAANRDAREPGDLDRALGATIKLRRRGRNITQEQLAQSCGLSFQQIQRYENGLNRISCSRLAQIAYALDCRVADLTRALEAVQAAAGVESISLMALPGAVDLLRRYAGMSPKSQRLLMAWLEGLQSKR